MTDSSTLLDVAIVGGGASGCALMVAAAAKASPEFRVAIFNPTDLGPGAAYAPQSASLLMNGPVRSMSVVGGDKQHLKRWLVDEADDTLICRARYGAYLRTTAAATLAARSRFAHVRSTIIDIERVPDGFSLTGADGAIYRARTIVLAMGNFAPGDGFVPQAILDFPGYAGDPWSMDISHFDDRDALLIGSRLTAMDTVALLDERAFRGNVHIVSRHGMLACLEDPRIDGLDHAMLALDVRTPYTLLCSLRAAVRNTNADWRAVVEAVRPRIPAIWSGWSTRERRRFLRHAQSAWAVHRYRVPAATHAAFSRLRDEGRIVLHRGRLLDARTQDDSIVLRIASNAAAVEIRASHVINCTGPNGNLNTNREPLIVNALKRGLIRADELRLGIDADESLRVIDAQGKPARDIFAMGPLLRGLWFETTAIPEIVSHAERIAGALQNR